MNCPGAQSVCENGQCVCVPKCQGKQCGDDGCGGSCGTCPTGETCQAQSGQCITVPTCTPQTCPKGCCDEGGVCQPGNTKQACGTGAVTCTVCGPNQTCSPQTGTCRDNPPCSPQNCPNGCCDASGTCRRNQQGCHGGGSPCCAGCCGDDGSGTVTCQSGDNIEACGANGAACVECDPFQGHCANGRCQCDAAYCAQVGSPNGCCENGPGKPGECFSGTIPQACGSDGAQCVSCPTGTVCCPNQSCGTVNGGTCTAGQRLLLGELFNGGCAAR